MENLKHDEDDEVKMPNQRKRSSERSLCPQYVLEEARRRIENGESKRKVASSYGMKESTLRYRLKRKEAATKLGRYDATLSPEIEQEFCNYLEDLDNMFQGMTPKNLRIAAYEFVVKNNIPHRFNAEKKMAGKHWLRGFLSQHPDLSLRCPTSTSIARAMGFNKPQCERFYKNLAELMDKYKFPPTSIYNMDETGLSTVPNNPPRVISKKGKRAVNKISSAERGTNVTVVNAMSASGHFIPAAFIFGRKRMKAELLDGAPPASIGMVSDTSYINSELFLNWLGYFKDHTRPTKEHPILLVLDNHVSHCTIGAVDFYRANNIIALTIPPHSSHKMQPLDKGFHSALKTYFASECEKWMRHHPGRAITAFQMTFNKAATVGCAAECFKVSGIYPYNPDIFTDADFLPSAVTEREMGDNQCSESQQENPQEATPHEQREPVMDNEPRASVFNKEPKKPSTPRNAFTAIENVSLVTEAPAEPVDEFQNHHKYLPAYRETKIPVG
ncbi:unnamed protein product [Acanthoscelides obtectus]|uniref:DDE-1 domain-containing protein n=1 Tax=Acanthoscelides obtectus TaxID=200917 RepID=A0A9P0KYX1_ACAOB|nr:unnamed protein product [Acanthoscelides obtectus]CAK1632848.1 hypothetical protein AOBTE_LOCUS7766 [Acanthoscelides obtectus]